MRFWGINRYILCFLPDDVRRIYYNAGDRKFYAVNEYPQDSIPLAAQLIIMTATAAAAKLVDAGLRTLFGSRFAIFALLAAGCFAMAAAFCFIEFRNSRRIEQQGVPWELRSDSAELIRTGTENLSAQEKAIHIEAAAAAGTLVLCMLIKSFVMSIGFIVLMGCIGATLSVVKPVSRYRMYRKMEEGRWI